MMPSNLQEFFGLIAFFGFAALVIHSLWQASKRVPPATDRLPAGVDGALLIVAGLAFLAGIYDAAAAINTWEQATLLPRSVRSMRSGRRFFSMRRFDSFSDADRACEPRPRSRLRSQGRSSKPLAGSFLPGRSQPIGSVGFHSYARYLSGRYG